MILNITNNGFRSVLVVVYRLLLQEKKLHRDKLISLCAPDTCVDPKTTSVQDVLTTWLDLGLFIETDGGVVINPEISKAELDENFLPKHARSRILAVENNQRFWEIDDCKASDFCRAVSWLLAQDVYGFDCLAWDDDAEVLIKGQLPDDDTLFGKNSTRWNGLKHWVAYLGFTWNSRYPRVGSFVIDPTPVVRDALPRIFNSREKIEAPDFVRALAKEVPVLDGGSYRVMVEDRMLKNSGEYAWKKTPVGQLSTSLSRAILRLIDDGTIVGDVPLSDSSVRVSLTGREGRVVYQFSHFELKSV